jgi:hypothetical protein
VAIQESPHPTFPGLLRLTPRNDDRGSTQAQAVLGRPPLLDQQLTFAPRRPMAGEAKAREADQHQRPGRRLRNGAAENKIARTVADNCQVYVRVRSLNPN